MTTSVVRVATWTELHDRLYESSWKEPLGRFRSSFAFRGVGRIEYSLETSLSRLGSAAEGDATLLDRSMVLYGSCLSEGNKHWHDNLPIVLAGRGGGTLAPGKLLAAPDPTPVEVTFDPAVVLAASRERSADGLTRSLARRLLRPAKHLLRPVASNLLGRLAAYRRG